MCGVGVLAVVPFMKHPLMLHYRDLKPVVPGLFSPMFLTAPSGEEPLHQ